jgi:VanZ family protein
MIITVRKFAILSLALYWPALVVLAHIPIPESVRRAHVSDKCLHFLAYLVLAFLLWFSVRPDAKVNWRKISVWLIFFGLMLYGSVDEVVQSYVGRTCDIKDVAANFTGVLFALVLLTFIRFRPAALITAGVVIFAVSNIAKANMAQMFPAAYGVFHFFAYAIFTVFWLLNMNLFLAKKNAKLRWLILAAGVPMIFLFTVKLLSAFLGRGIEVEDIIVPLAAILSVTAVSCLIDLYSGRINNKQSGIF